MLVPVHPKRLLGGDHPDAQAQVPPRLVLDLQQRGPPPLLDPGDGVVAADRLDALLQPVDSERQFQAPRRVTTDAPWTDWTQRYESNELWRLGTPVGTSQFPLPRNFNGDDPRVASDPWLASTRPTYLGDPNARVLSQNDPTRAYLDNRDWFQISNLAPDLRFVNLANLRGNFRAQPGVGPNRLGEGP